MKGKSNLGRAEKKESKLIYNTYIWLCSKHQKKIKKSYSVTITITTRVLLVFNVQRLLLFISHQCTIVIFLFTQFQIQQIKRQICIKLPSRNNERQYNPNCDGINRCAPPQNVPFWLFTLSLSYCTSCFVFWIRFVQFVSFDNKCYIRICLNNLLDMPKPNVGHAFCPRIRCTMWITTNARRHSNYPHFSLYIWVCVCVCLRISWSIFLMCMAVVVNM